MDINNIIEKWPPRYVKSPSKDSSVDDVDTLKIEVLNEFEYPTICPLQEAKKGIEEETFNKRDEDKDANKDENKNIKEYDIYDNEAWVLYKLPKHLKFAHTTQQRTYEYNNKFKLLKKFYYLNKWLYGIQYIQLSIIYIIVNITILIQLPLIILFITLQNLFSLRIFFKLLRQTQNKSLWFITPPCKSQDLQNKSDTIYTNQQCKPCTYDVNNDNNNIENDIEYYDTMIAQKSPTILKYDNDISKYYYCENDTLLNSFTNSCTSPVSQKVVINIEDPFKNDIQDNILESLPYEYFNNIIIKNDNIYNLKYIYIFISILSQNTISLEYIRTIFQKQISQNCFFSKFLYYMDILPVYDTIKYKLPIVLRAIPTKYHGNIIWKRHTNFSIDNHIMLFSTTKSCEIVLEKFSYINTNNTDKIKRYCVFCNAICATMCTKSGIGIKTFIVCCNTQLSKIYETIYINTFLYISNPPWCIIILYTNTSTLLYFMIHPSLCINSFNLSVSTILSRIILPVLFPQVVERSHLSLPIHFLQTIISPNSIKKNSQLEKKRYYNKCINIISTGFYSLYKHIYTFINSSLLLTISPSYYFFKPKYDSFFSCNTMDDASNTSNIFAFSSPIPLLHLFFIHKFLTLSNNNISQENSSHCTLKSCEYSENTVLSSIILYREYVRHEIFATSLARSLVCN